MTPDIPGMHRQLLMQYRAHQRVRGFSRRTIARRDWSLGLWATFLDQHDATIATATVEHLELFLGRWPSPQSRQSIRSDIRQLYRWAISRGLLDGPDPTDGLAAPKVPKRAATPVPADVVRTLIAAIDNQRDRRIVMLAAYAGLRISEIAALRWEDVDLAGRQLIVRSGKGGKDGHVPMSAELVANLSAGGRRTGRVIGISGPQVGTVIRRHYRRLGIEHRPHDLRHSFGTQAAVRTGGNLMLVAQLMRHEQVATTVRYVRWHTTGHEVVTGLYSDPSEAVDEAA